jgi:hypothetical protein
VVIGALENLLVIAPLLLNPPKTRNLQDDLIQSAAAMDD